MSYGFHSMVPWKRETCEALQHRIQQWCIRLFTLVLWARGGDDRVGKDRLRVLESRQYHILWMMLSMLVTFATQAFLDNFQWHARRPASQMRMRRFLSPERVASPVPPEEQARFVYVFCILLQFWMHRAWCCGWVVLYYLVYLHDTQILPDQSKWHQFQKKGFLAHVSCFYQTSTNHRLGGRGGDPICSSSLLGTWASRITRSCVDMWLEAMKHCSELLQIEKGNGFLKSIFQQQTGNMNP